MSWGLLIAMTCCFFGRNKYLLINFLSITYYGHRDIFPDFSGKSSMNHKWLYSVLQSISFSSCFLSEILYWRRGHWPLPIQRGFSVHNVLQFYTAICHNNSKPAFYHLSLILSSLAFFFLSATYQHWNDTTLLFSSSIFGTHLKLLKEVLLFCKMYWMCY